MNFLKAMIYLDEGRQVWHADDLYRIKDGKIEYLWGGKGSDWRYSDLNKYYRGDFTLAPEKIKKYKYAVHLSDAQGNSFIKITAGYYKDATYVREDPVTWNNTIEEVIRIDETLIEVQVEP